MRNKVEIRAFALEQVVKMRCMNDCTIDDVVEQSRLVERYIVGDAKLSESGTEVSEMAVLFKDALDRLDENRKDGPYMGLSGMGVCGIKDCEA